MPEPIEKHDVSPGTGTISAPTFSMATTQHVPQLCAISDLKEALRAALATLTQAVGCEQAAVFALGPTDDAVSLHTAHRLDEAFTRAARQLPLELPQPQAAPADPEWIKLAKLGGFEGLADTPLMAGTSVIGSLVLFFDRPRTLDDLEQVVLKVVADQISMGLRILQDCQVLQQERNLIQTIADNLSEGVVVVDEHDNIVTVNPAAHEILGVEPGQPWSFRPISNELTQRASALLAAHAPHSTDREEPTILENEGRLLGVASRPIVGDKGGASNTVYLIRDITHWVELDQIKSDFISQVSHELRTPLTTIKTLVGLLKKESSLSRDSLEHLDVINAEVDRQTRLVNDLLEIGRLETTDFTWTMVEVSLTDVVRRAVQSCQPLASEKDIALTGLPLPPLPRVMGTPRRLQEVLTNLLTNAIKYTPAGGRVSLEAGHDETVVWIAVRDTGPGIPNADLPYVFDKFYRARQNRRDNQGVGLGLAIAQQIVQALRGTIEVESEMGRGSCFTVRLPRAGAFVTAMREDLRRVRNGRPNPADR